MDGSHAFHARAHSWWNANSSFGWASCPLTENGVARIMPNPAYSPSSRFTIQLVINSLTQFASSTDHEFWPDDVSLRDSGVFETNRIHGARQLTDLYLLALAVKQRGRFATFDQAISISAVNKATAQDV